VARWRRPGANEILLVFLLLDALGCLCSWRSHNYSRQNPLWPFLSTAFLAWRVSRGGRISRMILIVGSGAAYATTALAVARRWLTAIQGAPLISKGALLRDSVQWALGCTSLLSLAWLRLAPSAAVSE
jgi:hypothetical protein